MATTGITPKEEAAFLRDTLNGKPLTPKQREELLKSHLPPPPTSMSSSSPSRTDPPRSKPQSIRLNKLKTGPIRNFLHFTIYHSIAFLFSIFFRFRRAWRLSWYRTRSVMGHHHHSPEWIVNDLKHTDQLPKHVSVVLDYHEDDEDQGTAGLEGLLNDVCEIAAWSAAAGIPLLSIYERTGALKNYPKQTYEAISHTLESYFGPARCPSLTIKSPHMPSYSRPTTPTPETTEDGAVASRGHLTVLFLSELDGRNTLIDLTVTLSSMAQKGDVHVNQINSSLIDAELHDHVSPDPDLLILFSPTVILKGYPPWQLRLTEIFHLPDNKGVNYQVFLQALKKFGKAEFRVGR